MRLALACLLVPVVCGLNTASEGGVPVLRRVARQPAIRILAGLDLLEEGKKPRRVTKPEKRAPAKSDGSSAAVMAVGALLTLLGASSVASSAPKKEVEPSWPVSELVAGLGDNVAQLVTSLMAFLTSLFAGLWSNLMSLMTSLSGGLQNLLPGVLSLLAGISGLFAGLWANLTSLITGLNLGENLASLATSLSDILKKLLAGVMSLLASLFDGITGLLTGLNLGERLTDLATSLMDGLKKLLAGILGALTGLWDALTSLLSGLDLEPLWEKLKALLTLVPRVLARLVHDLAALLMRLVAGLQQSLLASLTPREIAALAAVLAALVARYLGFFAPAPVQEASAATGTFLGMIGTF